MCDANLAQKVLAKEIQPFITLLIDKIQQLNFKAKDISLQSLVGLFNNPNLDVAMLIGKLIEVDDRVLDKHQWRGLLSRLEILNYLLATAGYDERKWSWRMVFDPLVAQGLIHTNPDVRQVSIDIVLHFISADEPAVSKALQAIDGIKPNILAIITKRQTENR